MRKRIDFQCLSSAKYREVEMGIASEAKACKVVGDVSTRERRRSRDHRQLSYLVNLLLSRLARAEGLKAKEPEI